MSESFSLNVNGEAQVVDVEPDSMLLYALRNDIGLHGPRFGCGLAECGACTVIIDGKATRSCVTKITDAVDHEITTLEGLGSTENPNPLQQAFIDEQAAQCGYCISGMIMAGQALLDENPAPDREAIKEALNGNLCRCGTHMRIVRAIEAAAKGAQG